jgi:energy-coupling factor transporter transmembrane protein EcfT
MAREKVFDYPNRRKSSSRATKWIVVALLLVSVVLMVVASVGGWEVLQGAKGMLVGFIVIYLLCAFFIARWRSGVLPVVAALAMVLLIFAAVSAPEWFQRDKTGFSESALARRRSAWSRSSSSQCRSCSWWPRCPASASAGRSRSRSTRRTGATTAATGAAAAEPSPRPPDSV